MSKGENYKRKPTFGGPKVKGLNKQILKITYTQYRVYKKKKL